MFLPFCIKQWQKLFQKCRKLLTLHILCDILKAVAVLVLHEHLFFLFGRRIVMNDGKGMSLPHLSSEFFLRFSHGGDSISESFLLFAES